MTALGLSIFIMQINDLREINGFSAFGFNLEYSTLDQRGWTKLGQEFDQDGQHTRCVAWAKSGK